MAIGSKLALSNNTEHVDSRTSDSIPPITPARATGTSPSQMRRSSANSSRSTPSRVVNLRISLAGFNGPPVIAAPSRATPAMPKQSPRFGVTAISNNQSSWLVPGSRSEVSDSTSMPAMVSSSASFSGATLSVTNSFSQLKVNFMRMKYWSVGVLEYWIGNLLLHHSTTPLKHSFLPELP